LSFIRVARLVTARVIATSETALPGTRACARRRGAPHRGQRDQLQLLLDRGDLAAQPIGPAPVGLDSPIEVPRHRLFATGARGDCLRGAVTGVGLRAAERSRDVREPAAERGAPVIEAVGRLGSWRGGGRSGGSWAEQKCGGYSRGTAMRQRVCVLW